MTTKINLRVIAHLIYLVLAIDISLTVYVFWTWNWGVISLFLSALGYIMFLLDRRALRLGLFILVTLYFATDISITTYRLLTSDERVITFIQNSPILTFLVAADLERIIWSIIIGLLLAFLIVFITLVILAWISVVFVLTLHKVSNVNLWYATYRMIILLLFDTQKLPFVITLNNLAFDLTGDDINPTLNTSSEASKKGVVFFNPYIAGPPVIDPNRFFGRQADLQKISNLLTGNFIMLTGPRRIGKTSLLYQLVNRLSQLDNTRQDFIPVLINVEGTLETEFFHSLMEEITETIKEYLPTEITGTLSFKVSNPHYSSRDFARDLQIILKQLKIPAPRPAYLVLLLDEMDTLNNYNLETQSQLRRIFQRFTNTNLSIVVAGVKLRQQWAGESSPFYNMFIPVTLSPFPETEARRLITEPVQGRYIYQDEAITRILQATAGLPHRIQQLCLEVINRVAATTEGRQEITGEDVDSILPTIQWLDEPTLAPDQATTIVIAQPVIAEDRTEYHPTTSTSTDQEAK